MAECGAKLSDTYGGWACTGNSCTDDLKNKDYASNWCSRFKASDPNPPWSVKGPADSIIKDGITVNYIPVSCKKTNTEGCDKGYNYKAYCKMNPDYPDPFYVKCCMNTAGDNYKYCPVKYCDDAAGKDNNCDNFMSDWCKKDENILSPECGCINAIKQAKEYKDFKNLPDLVKQLLPSACYPSCSGASSAAGQAYHRSDPALDECHMQLQVCQQIVNIMGLKNAKNNTTINQICKQHWNQITDDPNKTSPDPNKTSPDPNKTSPDPNKTSPDPNKTSPDPNKTSPNSLVLIISGLVGGGVLIILLIIAAIYFL